jgi:hypothetical protein
LNQAQRISEPADGRLGGGALGSHGEPPIRQGLVNSVYAASRA